MFGGPLKKSARNRGNVKYVKCVKCFGGNSAKNTQTFNIFNISPVLSIFGKKHLTFPLFREPRSTKQGKYSRKIKKTLKTGEMLNMLNVFGGPLKKVLETGEMLNMLNVLNVLGEIQPKTPKHLTYLTFPLF